MTNCVRLAAWALVLAGVFYGYSAGLTRAIEQTAGRLAIM